MTNLTLPAPPDQAQREQALDPTHSILVQAPAGSGKTDLLTRRFLRLLAEVDDPAQIVAITFTRAAAAEMRHRILSELERAADPSSSSSADEFSMDALAERALRRSRALGWNLLDLPAQLRISTIDSFCREIAIRQPLLSTLGSGLEVREQPEELYRRAARITLMRLSRTSSLPNSPGLDVAIESLLDWRDNNWPELENQLVAMLCTRDRWMQDFWLREVGSNSETAWDALRQRLERPFARAVAEPLAKLSQLLQRVPGTCDEAMELARFACKQSGNTLHRELAELAEFPCHPFHSTEELEEARIAYTCLADFLLTDKGAFRKTVNVSHGFPLDRKREKQRLQELICKLMEIEGLESSLAAVRELPPARYTEEDWRIVRACFTLLRHAAGELQVVFAEAGAVDFIEVAHIAQHLLVDEDNLPSDAAIEIADGIHHLLVDEFQDTSRRQHRLIAALVAAWPDTEARTLFVVGDPMQSIYFFRDADAELFPRVQTVGLELPDAEPHLLDFVRLASNFRAAPELVDKLNQAFDAVFAVDDGSQVTFSPAQPVRIPAENPRPAFDLHLEFVPQIQHAGAASSESKREAAEARQSALETQTAEIVALIRSHLQPMEQARLRGDKYRVAVLGRARSGLAPIAQALRDAAIPFRAMDLEQLAARPEVLDALALARALLNAEDRVAWLGVLRAPWCGLSLKDLHTLTSADDSDLLGQTVPALLQSRASLLSPDGRVAVNRLMQALAEIAALRSAMPDASPGTWLEQAWLRLGGASCVDAAARANLDLLWRSLDKLPGGEPDLAGPALSAALDKLTAQPDPDAGHDCGVHLMTIHKAKGLEFEVVIVPELQAGSGRTRGGMLSWLERGLASSDDSGEITEFLVAPFQTKGSDRGKAKQWVDREYRAREAQETRRVLYVAATRAREELHLFARPAYKLENGELILCQPSESLLSTAWPGLEAEVRARFDAWKAQQEPPEVEAIAAGADNLIVMPSPAKPAVLRRLPPEFQLPALSLLSVRAQSSCLAADPSNLYQRHEGGLLSRAMGSAVHLLLEELARLRTMQEWDGIRANVAQLGPRVAAQLRAAGMDREQADTIAAQAIDVVTHASYDAVAAWILSPHADAASETRWAGVVDGAVRTIQADRVFRGGGAPLQDGNSVWWIVDYKTAHADNADPSSALPKLRNMFAPQLELYAQVLRKLHGQDTLIRAGLYYPRMLAFDWWEV
ncbi:MAG TPA: UvrD-helicase domain-containing protein [Terracidiphilus sp.]|jgi:ATP-dependent exoDNAse (exonuclease V) beta subunit|nr:UvrD-helicase domain-containing protein [Terracidiphilus sp.]